MEEIPNDIDGEILWKRFLLPEITAMQLNFM